MMMMCSRRRRENPPITPRPLTLPRRASPTVDLAYGMIRARIISVADIPRHRLILGTRVGSPGRRTRPHPARRAGTGPAEVAAQPQAGVSTVPVHGLDAEQHR